MSGRGQFPRNRGRARGRGFPGGNPRRPDRDQYRAWQFQERNNTDWSESKEYETHEEHQTPSRSTRNRKRSEAWKNKKQDGAKKEVIPPKVEKATAEDLPADEPLYDSTPFTAGVPINQEYTQSFDLSGFPLLCQETYQTLQEVNPRLTRDMPFPEFLHSMNAVLQTSIMDSVFDYGQRPVPGCYSRAYT